MESLGELGPVGSAISFSRVPYRLTEAGNFFEVARVAYFHGAFMLGAVAQKGLDLCAQGEFANGFEVVCLVGLEEQQCAWPVVHAQLRKEVWVSRGNQGIGGNEPGGAMVRMQPVSLPRIMGYQHVGLVVPNQMA